MNLSFAAKGEEAMRTKQGKIRAFALTGLSVILVLGATHSTANAQGGDSYYNIRNKNSELYLQVEGEGTHHGANVVQANFEDRDDFKWSLELEKGDYKIQNKNSKLYLQVYDKQTHHGANVVQANFEDRDDFKWSLELEKGDYYNIRNKNSELYLQVFDKQTHHGANVIQANLEDRDDFKWNLRLASGESPDYNCRFADFHGGLKESDANRV
jgi:hypothetical protein